MRTHTYAHTQVSDDVPISAFGEALVDAIREQTTHSVVHLTKEAVVTATGKDPAQCNAEE